MYRVCKFYSNLKVCLCVRGGLGGGIVPNHLPIKHHTNNLEGNTDILQGQIIHLC